MGSSLGDGVSASRQLVTQNDGDETVRRRGCPVSPTSVSGASTPVTNFCFSSPEAPALTIRELSDQQATQIRGLRSRTQEDDGGEPERRVLFRSQDSAPSPGSPPSRQCKGKMPADEASAPKLGAWEDLSMCDTTSSSHVGDATNCSQGFLQGRKRALGEALGDVSKSSAALHDVIARSGKRQERGGDWCSGSHRRDEALEGSSARRREAQRAGDGGLEELLECMARAGDERLMWEARTRAGGITSTFSSASLGEDDLPLLHRSPQQHPENPQQNPQIVEGGGGSEGAGGDDILEITHWRRSLVRRVEGRGAGGSIGGEEDVGHVWRVQVSGKCSALSFVLSLIVNKGADAVVLEALEVDACAALELEELAALFSGTASGESSERTACLPAVPADDAAAASAGSSAMCGSSSAVSGIAISGGISGCSSQGSSSATAAQGSGGSAESATAARSSDDQDGRGSVVGVAVGGGGGGDVQDVMRLLALYGAMARRRTRVITGVSMCTFAPGKQVQKYKY